MLYYRDLLYVAVKKVILYFDAKVSLLEGKNSELEINSRAKN
jgi:hypothetical protein